MQLLRDVRYALRMLRKHPGFTLVAVLTLALGIGVNTAIFSVVHALLIKPLPYPGADRLVMLWQDLRAQGGPADEWATPGNYADWREERQVFEHLAALTGWQATLTGLGDPEVVPGEQVSHEYLSVLGVAPVLGRGFAVADDVPNARRVVILGHGTWQRLFGGDHGAVGRTITLNGEPHEIIGVLPAGFRAVVNAEAGLWRPLRLNTANPSRGAVVLRIVARLVPDTTVEEAQTAATLLAARLEAAHPEYNAKSGINVMPLHEWVVGEIRPALVALLGGVTIVLLIACANVANLLLARGSTRRREFAVRVALGAGRARVARQLLTESVLLAAVGGALGVLLGAWTLDALVVAAPQNTPRLAEVSLDRTVLGFAALLTVVTGLVFGLAPALQSRRFRVADGLKDGVRGPDTSGVRLRRALIVAEVALALVLLSAAGLLFQTFARVQNAHLGFDPVGVLVGSVNPPQSAYDTRAKHRAFYDQVLERAAALPGAQTAALTSVLPLGGDTDMNFSIEGRPVSERPGEAPVTWYRLVSDTYFEAMGMTIRRGRRFQPREAGPAVIVNETFARRYFPGEDAIGRRVRFGTGTETPWVTIVGVVADAKGQGARSDTRVEAFIPYWQFTEPGMAVILKASPGIDPGRLASPLRQSVLSIDANVPVSGIVQLTDRVSESVAQPRFLAALALLFAALALLLAVIGLYGVMAYVVSQRTGEIGLRMALGATSAEMFRLVLRDGLRLTTAGVVLGIVGAVAAGQWLSSLLYEIRPGDPITITGTTIVLLFAAIAACLAPARRATRVDPLVALRTE